MPEKRRKKLIGLLRESMKGREKTRRAIGAPSRFGGGKTKMRATSLKNRMARKKKKR